MLALWSSAAPALRARAVQFAADHAETAPRSPAHFRKIAGAPLRAIGSDAARLAPIRERISQVNSFQDLPLVEPLRRALAEEGYAVPTPIQAQAIPYLLAGRDLL